MSFQRGMGGSEPIGPEPVGSLSGTQEERRATRSSRLAVGTLACPACDAPVAPAPGASSPADAIACPYCRHAAAVRDFLSLTAPSRPARVEVRVVQRARPRAASRTMRRA
jgi:hypothetical protein